MPPSRDPVWDHFYSLKTDFREPAIDLELQARKNASYDNAWCKACVDHMLGQVEYSHWIPVGQCTQDYLDLLRRYRVMKVITPIRGQPKNLDRHMRTCKHVPDEIRPPPLEKRIKEFKPKLESNTMAGPSTLADITLSNPNSNVNTHTQANANAIASSSQLPIYSLPPPPVDTSIPLDPSLPQTPSRLTRQKQAELDADIYNLFMGLGIPFDDRTCSVYGQFVRKWIPGAKWGDQLG